jgi:hypothetical protein
MLGMEVQIQNPSPQALVQAKRSALTAVRKKSGHLDTQWLTGLAAIAVGAVGEQAAPAKTL